MNKPHQNKRSKLSIFAYITTVITVVSLLVTGLGMLATTPTAKHRQVVHDFNLVSLQYNSGSRSAADEAEYKRLQQVPELQYSIAVGAASSVIQLIVGIAIIGYTYRYVRKNHLFKKDALATALMYIIAWSITLCLIEYLETSFITKVPFDYVSVLYRLLMNGTLGLLVAYLIVRIFKWQYNRKHSFIVE